jgi:anti-sigma regulatory factor (Ser/Thr protein kinase)
VALLVAQFAPARQRRWRTAVSTTTQPAGNAVSAARRASATVLAEWGASPETSWDLLLAASELVTNAIRHGDAPIELRLRQIPDGIVLEVHDGSSVLPARSEPAPDASNGRGLYLVEAVSSSWGVRPTGNGKSIWCVVP